MKRNRTLKVLTGTLLLMAGAVWAGVAGSLTCLNERCGHKAGVRFGGGFTFEEITGYCVNCEKFVSLRWSRPEFAKEGDAKPPVPLGNVWDPVSGKTLEVHKCPKCAGPFLPIPRGGPERCPKCGQGAKFKGEMHYD